MSSGAPEDGKEQIQREDPLLELQIRYANLYPLLDDGKDFAKLQPMLL